ncbi:aldo/keto reductase [bacterium]|nr:aldo/keto reductase [bacterium]
MRTRPLGQSNIEASVVVLGAWAIGGWMWGGSDEKASIQAIHAALDNGINCIDTAAIYGFGLSEEVVGKAVRDRRDQVVLATKCGMVADMSVGEERFRSNAHGPDPLGLLSIRVYLHPDSIRQEVELSLKRLQTDCIDLYQTHWQAPGTPLEEVMGTLMALKDEGKIRAIGVSNASSSQVEKYRSVGPLDSDQEKYSMIDRGIEEDQLPYCEKHNVAVLAYSPLGQGLLTGKVTLAREFDEGDLRRSSKRFSKENRGRVLQMLEKFKPVAENHGVSLAQLAVAWTAHQPGLTHVICGIRTIQQAEENAAAGDVILGKDELKTIDDAIDEYAGAIV